jgi:hypothetical protein
VGGVGKRCRLPSPPLGVVPLLHAP